MIINDDAELAARLGVGLHLGQGDGSLSVARALLGRKAIIGGTCHASWRWRKPPPKKAQVTSLSAASSIPPPSPAHQRHIELLDAARAQISLPIVAIGGVTLDNAPR
jgi:thiamine-phosphate pyrophosphorylase